MNSKWITNPAIKFKIIKLLKDKMGENLDKLGFGDNFLVTTSKAQLM